MMIYIMHASGIKRTRKMEIHKMGFVLKDLEPLSFQSVKQETLPSDFDAIHKNEE